MKKVVLRMGGIAGLILAIMLALSLFFMDGHLSDQAMRYGEIIGYATMIIALSLIYVGIKNVRDHDLGGNITFGQGFRIGILITLVASCIYVISWMLLSRWLAPDFMERYAEYSIRALEDKGASAAEVAALKVETERYIELYRNPLIKAGMTFMEVFPVGLLITLVSAFFLKRKISK